MDLNIKLNCKSPMEGQIVRRKSRFAKTIPHPPTISSHDYSP